MLSVGLAMIVLNEPIDRVAMLVEYLRPLVSQFSISDTGSLLVDDNERIMGLWPEVVPSRQEPVTSFSEARNRSTEPLTTDLVLQLDADELPSFEMMKHLLWIRENMNDKVMGYQFWTQNWWAGEPGQSAPYHWHCRLFRREHGRYYKAVHEQVEIKHKNRWYKEEQANSLGYLTHAAKEAYLIHSKPRETMERANELYSKIGEGPVL